jgi:hypothetical protein
LRRGLPSSTVQVNLDGPAQAGSWGASGGAAASGPRQGRPGGGKGGLCGGGEALNRRGGARGSKGRGGGRGSGSVGRGRRGAGVGGGSSGSGVTAWTVGGGGAACVLLGGAGPMPPAELRTACRSPPGALGWPGPAGGGDPRAPWAPAGPLVGETGPRGRSPRATARAGGAVFRATPLFRAEAYGLSSPSVAASRPHLSVAVGPRASGRRGGVRVRWRGGSLSRGQGVLLRRSWRKRRLPTA